MSQIIRSWEYATGCVVLSLGIILAASASFAIGPDSNPRILVPETTYDFGDIFVGQYMYHVFPIRNEGAATLTLSDDLPGKPATRPSPQVSPTARVYTDPGGNANPPTHALEAGEAFGVSRDPACCLAGALVAPTRLAAGAPALATRSPLPATQLAGVAHTATWNTNGEATLISPMGNVAPTVSGEPVPT